ncbi:type VI secretion system membrane subunit TssM [Oceanospirillum sediminis]|uniref:Type VI secretion system membrane subunit TssM n=1 Tax=Oceanospirillum sediminis TaxID=2760088 RepID=A0A839INX7_9GAMM|nr:type VI secretion system membrane subunit TssM [Oceanospirillum sediminis]MBB1486601.1 type VI secretion system membrane subunit TssM [Oceanospirillum sediminis]
MEKIKLAYWPFVLLMLVLSVVFWLGSLWFEWWQWQPLWLPVLSAGLSLLLAALISFGWRVLRLRQLRNQPSEDVLRQKQQMAYQQKRMIALFNACWRQLKPRQSDPYQVPWYFVVHSQSMADDDHLLRMMGMEPVMLDDRTDGDLPVHFWISEFAVLISLPDHWQDEGTEACVQTVLNKLKSHRPRQAANGVLLATPVRTLLNTQQTALDALARQQKQILQTLNKQLGVNLPVYSLLTRMADLTDFSESFAVLDEHRQEEPFGAMMPVPDKPGYDAQWFDQSFDQLQSAMTQQISAGLKLQLNSDFRSSVLAAPFQFGLLKSELGQYFSVLFLDYQFEEAALNFRGYFFTSTHKDSIPVDPLSQHLSSDLEQSRVCGREAQTHSRGLFAKQLLRREILSERFLVGVNTTRENLYRVMKFTWTGGLIALFLCFLWLLKANFDYFHELDNRALAQAESYKRQLAENPPDTDDLASPIFSLSELRNVSLIYSEEPPWYVQSWLPDPSIRHPAYAAYQTELKEILLIVLRDYLMKDLYVYNKLEDRVKTLELFNLQQLLFSPDRDNNDALMDYYIHFMQEEGQGDPDTLEHFRLLAADLLKPGVVPPANNEPLVELVRNRLSTEDISDLLYQHILQQPGFSERLDMRERLGQHYRQTLAFDEAAGAYMIPYIFTHEGFRELMQRTGFQLAQEALKDYEGVIDRISNENELNRINRKLKQRYIDDYTAYWQRLVTGVEWQSPDSWASTHQQLTLLSDPVFSPLKRFYRLVSYHTNPDAEIAPAESAEEEKKKGIKLKGKVAKVAKQAEAEEAEREARLAAERQENARRVAEGISQSFEPYHNLIKADETGQTRLDLALNQLIQIQEWLKKASGEVSRGQYFLNQLAEATSISPLERTLTLADNYQSPLLRTILAGLSDQVNGLAMTDIRALINRDWQRNVLDYYNAQIASFYPFSQQAVLDVSLKAFEDFFAPKGMMADFANQYLVYFSARENSHPVLQSFLPGRFMSLSAGFWRSMDAVSDIQSAFFIADTFGLQFAVRTQQLTPQLTEFSIASDRVIYSYRNGPSLWKNIRWPISGSEAWDLSVRLKSLDASQFQQTYTGIWSWFRLAQALNGQPTQERAISLLTARHGEASAKILLRVDGDNNPFVKGFFDQVMLPGTI